MLAAFDFATYTTLTLPIRTGDRIVLYTDGMVEATNIHQQEFGPDRLHDIVRATANLTDTEAADQIISSIQHWSATQSDDLTIILCDYTA
jgi:sigma-B regulation protein RsbU (phosphoserine phosphatase)